MTASNSTSIFGLALILVLPAPALSAASGFELRTLRPSTNASRAIIYVHPNQRLDSLIPKFITGKFAEHLGWNIYNGMDAQILRNPTFADYPIWTGQMNPDGVTKFYADDDRINEELGRLATRFGWPESDRKALLESRLDALACFWMRQGSRAEIQLSPDTGPLGGRAQRVEVKAAGRGIAQWTWLPLHRQRQYQIEVMARSDNVPGLTVSLWRDMGELPVATARLDGLSHRWQKLHGTFQVPSDLPAAASYKLTITADAAGEFVIRHAFLLPADQIGGADADVIRFLKESHLPLLRWPGGNFVSTYHWQDGIGPVEGRLTKPNFAWGGTEPNTFGTDEFVAFCRAVGCEPMICINGGSATPEEAARWVEYCNGPATSPMGQLREANGHPKPFRVQHWEVGNELWGHWQMDWTTPGGYVDRYHSFVAALRAADPTIHLYACGAPAMGSKEWNDRLIAGAAATLESITDHPLIGGNVSPAVDPLDVYRDFMALPEVLQQKWASLHADMNQGGVRRPRLAVTELQLFAHLDRNADSNAVVRLNRENMPGQASITEALYDVLIYHAAVRLSPFVELITHSAVVNHGGGLRKERERVWANPCHYAQGTFAAFAEAAPVALEIETPLLEAPLVLPDLKKVTNHVSYGCVDALAAIAKDGSLLVSLVNRGNAAAPLQTAIDLGGFKAADLAKVRSLSADTPWSQDPEVIQPHDSIVPVHDGKLVVDLAPFSVVRVQVGLQKE